MSETGGLSDCRAQLLRELNRSRNFVIDEYAHPGFQIQQPPDAISVVAMMGAMLGKKAFDRLRPEQLTVQRSRLEQHALQIVELRSGEPISPWCGKSHLLAIHNRMRQQILYRGFQNV